MRKRAYLNWNRYSAICWAVRTIVYKVGIYNSQYKCTGKVGGEHDYVEMDDDRQTIYV